MTAARRGGPGPARALLAVCLVAVSVGASAQGSNDKKKELVARAVQLQMPGIEQLARGLVEQPAAQMLRQAGLLLQERATPEQREAMGKKIQDSTNKFVEETTPLVRDRAVKLAPGTLGAALEEKFTEDELKQLVAWLESPVSRKYQQILPEVQGNFVQKLVGDTRGLVDPKLKVLEQSVRTTLGALAQGPASGPSPAPAPKPAASGATRPAGK
ncbi:MAG: DUF2059 domain-containing protein [Ideonella sp.]|nr:DUF2059 domain-containing protein [Ideonella sp.]